MLAPCATTACAAIMSGEIRFFLSLTRQHHARILVFRAEENGDVFAFITMPRHSVAAAREYHHTMRAARLFISRYDVYAAADGAFLRYA